MLLTRFPRRRVARRLHGFLFLLALLAGASSPVQAAQIFVTSLGDAQIDGDGCSLREAILNANSNTRRGSIECVMGDDVDDGGDVILLPPDKIMLAATGEDDASLRGDFDITSRITIKGGGGVWTILDAGNFSRIFDVHGGAFLALDGIQLSRGLVTGDGGAVLVRGGGQFTADYVQFRDSQVTGSGTRGGGLFVADNADALVRRSDFARNVASGTGGAGGGAACEDGCTLRIEHTTFTANRAADAGGNLLVADGGRAALFFTTVANGLAPAGSGISNAGELSLYASLVADNGVGSTGSDLQCVNAASPGSSITVGGLDTFIEAPVQDCSLPPTFDTKALLASAATLPESVFYAVNDLPFQGPPSLAHRPREGFARLAEFQTAPNASYSDPLSPLTAATLSCATIRDQHGRNHRAGIYCNRGAVQFPNLSVWNMSLLANAGSLGSEYAIYVSDAPAAGFTVLVEPAGGIGEPCGNFSIPVVFSPGQYVGTFRLAVPEYDGSGNVIGQTPAPIFNGPALDRPRRVCNLSVRLLDGDGDDANDLNGGLVRVKVTDRLITTAGFSTPLPGRTLNIGSVAVSAGGVDFLRLTPDAASAGFHVTSLVISGADASRFVVDETRPIEWLGFVGGAWVKLLSHASETAPGSGIWTFSATHASTVVNDVAVPSASNGGVAFPVRCLPGHVGDFQAELAVNTDSPTFGNLVYGIKCSAGHVLSVVAGSARIEETDAAGYPLTLRLDTHALSGALQRCLLDDDALDGDDGDGTCLEVQVIDTTSAGPGSASARTYAGTAVSVAGDYEPFSQTVTFAPGDTEKTIRIPMHDDVAVEGAETFSYRVDLVPGGLSNARVTLAAGAAGTVTITDDDQPLREVSLHLCDVPPRAAPGQQVRYRLLAHNRGTETAEGVSIEFVVEQPMWVRSIGLTPEEMTRLGIDSTKVNCSVATSKRRAFCAVGVDLLFNQRNIATELGKDEDDVLADCKNGGTVWQSRKDWIEFTGVLVTADMRKPPTLDVSGMVSASVSAGLPAASAVKTGVVTIDAPSVNSAGGAPGFGLLALLGSLAIRRRFLSTGGRNNDR